MGVFVQYFCFSEKYKILKNRVSLELFFKTLHVFRTFRLAWVCGYVGMEDILLTKTSVELLLSMLISHSIINGFWSSFGF